MTTSNSAELSFLGDYDTMEARRRGRGDPQWLPVRLREGKVMWPRDDRADRLEMELEALKASVGRMSAGQHQDPRVQRMCLLLQRLRWRHNYTLDIKLGFRVMIFVNFHVVKNGGLALGFNRPQKVIVMKTVLALGVAMACTSTRTDMVWKVVVRLAMGAGAMAECLEVQCRFRGVTDVVETARPNWPP